jgi:hypothetical protein
LLFLLLERLHTTHDTEKLKTFGSALANAGDVEFRDDPREDYVRILRELTLKELNILRDEKLTGWLPHITRIKYAPEIMSGLFRLQAMGLVLERLRVSNSPHAETGDEALNVQLNLSHLMTEPPIRTFHLTAFGERFLKFIAAEKNAHESNTV